MRVANKSNPSDDDKVEDDNATQSADKAEEEKVEKVPKDILDMQCNVNWICPVKFRVRWENMDESQDTWVFENRLRCTDIIKEFLAVSGRTAEYQKTKDEKSEELEFKHNIRESSRRNRPFTYSELDEDQDEIIPSGTRSRKPRIKIEEEKASLPPKKKRKRVDSSDSQGREYEVRQILAHRTKGNITEFKVRWKGCSEEEDSWVPQSNLNCAQLLVAYFKTPVEESDEGECEVEKVIDVRKRKNAYEYKVKWKGWSSNFNSWVPEKDLNCPDKIREFNMHQEKKKTKQEDHNDDEQEEEEEEDDNHKKKAKKMQNGEKKKPKGHDAPRKTPRRSGHVSYSSFYD